jgi:hypothetical protein
MVAAGGKQKAMLFKIAGMEARRTWFHASPFAAQTQVQAWAEVGEAVR